MHDGPRESLRFARGNWSSVPYASSEQAPWRSIPCPLARARRKQFVGSPASCRSCFGARSLVTHPARWQGESNAAPAPTGHVHYQCRLPQLSIRGGLDQINLFPYEIVRDAWVAGKAAREALANEFDQMPPGALTFETAPGTVQTAPQVADAQTPDQRLILMTGGPYKLMAKCPELGCLAWIMDRSGSVYHTWPLSLDVP
jgi:hypothetical protein